MTIRVAIHHITEYKFDKSISLFPHQIRLKPAPHSRTKIHSYSLKVHPEEQFINWQQDPFGNFVARLVFPEKSRSLKIEVEVVVDMTAINPFDFFVEEFAENFPFKYLKQQQKELQPYLEVIENSLLIHKWLERFKRKICKKNTEKDDSHSALILKKKNIKIPINDFLVAINQQLHQSIAYEIRMETGVQSCDETLERAKGSCRDSAWLLVQLMRHLGIAARFASGYLVQLSSDQKSLDGGSGPEKDFTDLHAWCEAYIPGAGWIGLDPTSGLLTGEGHIPLACTPDPISAAPITGSTEPSQVEFFFENSVKRIHEDPRVTKPYNHDQWQTILALGKKVDLVLQDQDVRLTTGGEPTFVSIDDMESAQWSTEALGDDKLKLAKRLLLKLRDRFAPSGLLHYGQGKWYPGEEIPRWALGCIWRTDDQALWKNPLLLAGVDKDYGHTSQDACNFMQHLMRELNINVAHITPAYEDVLYYLWLEQRQAINRKLVQTQSQFDDDLERKRLVKCLSQGLEHITGYTVLIDWDYAEQRWSSLDWNIRHDKLFLHPGDSPMGLRLPLDTLPEIEKAHEKFRPERDPFSIPLTLSRSDQGDNSSPFNAKSPYITADSTVRTALCTEARDGRVHVFLPPIIDLEHYLLLIAAIERTAEALHMPIVIEGYEPPKDARLCKLLVTPDPGVIEVNIHPSSSWHELVDNTKKLYEAAHECRLGTEKFMLDGRHGGTGGGNHVTFGAAHVADSPFLRRPDLLMSLVTYWQHHPSLSYLFSGMFIGPTSQSPRVDEARNESLYELEIAFQQMPNGEVKQPWLIDRLMRNLLVDITGNTHRSEFCIDKLYAPNASSGRQGLLEFRGFEMPPHYQMSTVQTLLLQCLISRFWKQPYKKPLIRWGTALHDRFMLPHYVWSDINDVIQDLNQQGYEFDVNWLAPFEEFRFPHYGRVQLDGIEIELRWAIEPWHVLGEEVGRFGTARYVDSSVERLQVKVKGLTPDRYVLTCNGRRVNLNATGKHGEYVAGVRYRAWQPPSALHPTIGVHTPLVFDLIDTWNGKSIGGCTYHVSHPGGRSYERFPVNPVEAESRRSNRFFNEGHSAGSIIVPPLQGALREFFPHTHEPRPMEPPHIEPSNEYPYTLDLRKV